MIGLVLRLTVVFCRGRRRPVAEATGRNSREFHLGEFLSVLQNTTWVGFDVEITKAHRTPLALRGQPRKLRLIAERMS